MKAAGIKHVQIVMAIVLAIGASVYLQAPARAEAPPAQVWAQIYTVAGFDSFQHSSRSIGVDAYGNAYVTGSAHSGRNIDMVTVKYSPAGEEQWVRRYNHTGNSEDEGVAIAVDPFGNAYVTGWGYKAPGDPDMITVKYGPDGTQLWAQAYDNSSRTEVGRAITLDGLGNAYVTGFGTNASGRNNFLTVKYDAAGNQQWASYYDGLGYSNAATAIAFDGMDVYVTGECYNAGADVDYATVKYSGADGTMLWAACYNFSGRHDIPSAIAVDQSGAAYVTGYSCDADGHPAMCTIKYGPWDGAQLWVSRDRGAGNIDAFAQGLALDSAGNAFVTGYCRDAIGNSKMYTIKYSSGDGSPLWSSTYEGAHQVDRLGTMAAAIAVDGRGNAYITGPSRNSRSGYDYTTIKYSAGGQQQWVVLYDGPAHGSDLPNAMALYGSDIYITGVSVNAGNHVDWATVKYSTESAIAGVHPASAVQGQCPLTVTITGNNFLGTTAVSFGPGITVNSFKVDTLSQITAVICIGEGTPAGAHTVRVTTALGTATLPAAFTVNQLPRQLPVDIGTGTHASPTVNAPANPTPPIVNPVILTQSASLSAAAVAPGTPVTVTADIANKSTVNGSKNIQVYVNGQLEASRGVTVNSGGSMQVAFNITRDEPGAYTVYVDGTNAGSFKVDQFTPDTILFISWALVFLALVVGVIYITRRTTNR